MANNILNEKVCPCGRIITDPKNISGLCPRCKKAGLEVGIPVLLTGATAVVKTYGKPLVEEAVKMVKNARK